MRGKVWMRGTDKGIVLMLGKDKAKIKLKNYGPYKTRAGAERGAKQAAKLFDVEIGGFEDVQCSNTGWLYNVRLSPGR